MQNGHTKKLAAPKKTVAVNLKGIPIEVHNRMKLYRMKLFARDQRDIKLSRAYVEFVIEFSKGIQL
jgi:hypothetical protein